MCGPHRPRKNSISTESEVNEAAGARQSSCRSAWLALGTAPAILPTMSTPPPPLRPHRGRADLDRPSGADCAYVRVAVGLRLGARLTRMIWQRGKAGAPLDG
jgi:hypothetical protein